MALPTFTMRRLLEAGVHFGHQTRRWNPKMAPFLFGERNDVHIIDLQQTVPLLYAAMKAIRRRRRRRRPRAVCRHETRRPPRPIFSVPTARHAAASTTSTTVGSAAC